MAEESLTRQYCSIIQNTVRYVTPAFIFKMLVIGNLYLTKHISFIHILWRSTYLLHMNLAFMTPPHDSVELELSPRLVLPAKFLTSTQANLRITQSCLLACKLFFAYFLLWIHWAAFYICKPAPDRSSQAEYHQEIEISS